MQVAEGCSGEDSCATSFVGDGRKPWAKFGVPTSMTDVPKLKELSMAAKCFAQVPLSGQSCQNLEGSSCDRVVSYGVPYTERIRVFALYTRQNLGIHSWRTVGVLQAGNDLLYDLSRVLSLHATSCALERNCGVKCIKLS